MPGAEFGEGDDHACLAAVLVDSGPLGVHDGRTAHPDCVTVDGSSIDQNEYQRYQRVLHTQAVAVFRRYLCTFSIAYQAEQRS